jgi:hypothetical protein
MPGKWDGQMSGRNQKDDRERTEQNVGFSLNARLNQDLSGLQMDRAGFFREHTRIEENSFDPHNPDARPFGKRSSSEIDGTKHDRFETDPTRLLFNDHRQY